LLAFLVCSNDYIQTKNKNKYQRTGLYVVVDLPDNDDEDDAAFVLDDDDDCDDDDANTSSNADSKSSFISSKDDRVVEKELYRCGCDCGRDCDCSL
jgi:hypothetical protein